MIVYAVVESDWDVYCVTSLWSTKAEAEKCAKHKRINPSNTSASYIVEEFEVGEKFEAVNVD